MSNAIANDRLRKRFERWDADGNGRLEPRDFQEEAARIAQGFGVDAGSEQIQTLNDAFKGLFDYLVEKAGTSEEGVITEEQFLRVTGDMLFKDGEAEFNRALGPVVQAIIGICDKDHDGKIDASEFEAWLAGIGVPRSEAEEVFRKVDTDGNGVLSQDELLHTVREYHFGRLDVELLG